jgi:hypothetical protein
MVTPPKDSLTGDKRSPFPETQPIVRRSSQRPCPECGSMTVRSRDGRDLCVICGYSRRIRRNISRPFMSGISMSNVITSGVN